MRLFQILWQILLLCGITWLGEALARVLEIGIPGSILGLLLLLLALERRWIRMEWVEMGANFLIAELLLFFIPSAIGVMQFQELLQAVWLKLFLSIGISIAFVVCFVGAATEWIVRRREGSKKVC